VIGAQVKRHTLGSARKLTSRSRVGWGNMNGVPLRLLLALSVCFALSGCASAPARVGVGTVPSSTPSRTATGASSDTTTPASSQTTTATKTPAAVPTGLHHPPLGSAERRAILDGLRTVIEHDLGQKIIFVVNEINVKGGFAYVDSTPRTPAGGKIDYAKTRHAAQMREGVLDGGNDASALALLRHGTSGWHVLTFVIGPTDVAYAGWWKEFHAPKAIFPYTE